MHEYHIRDICRILREKKHIIRYWEQEISFLNPRKDIYGNRIYTNHDINLLFRLKYLVHFKGMHLARASEVLWGEIISNHQEKRLKIHELRIKFVLLQEKVYSQSRRIEKIFDMKMKSDDTKDNESQTK